MMRGGGENKLTITSICIHAMRDERRKKERSKQCQTNSEAKQHSTPKPVTFPKKNELPLVGNVHDRYTTRRYYRPVRVYNINALIHMH